MKVKLLIISIFFHLFTYSKGRIDGLIPLEMGAMPASDLVYKDQVLTPEEAYSLVEDSDGVFDLSKLDPSLEQNIWKNEYPKSLSKDENEINLEYFDTVYFNGSLPSRDLTYRFLVEKLEPNSKKQYTIYTSKTVHNILIQSALLRKIGYQVPEIKYLSKVKVKFSNENAKIKFKKNLNRNTLGSSERWVALEKKSELVLQDVIAMSPTSEIYNFALANDLGEVAGNRRLFNALLVPYSLVNVPESINVFPFEAARVYSKHIKMDLDKTNDFNCSLSDAKWITRRILKLSRSDFEEIVNASNMPEAIKLVLVEKLIARRNQLASVFDLDHHPMEVNTALNSGEDVVEGKVIKDEFEGYARRFSGQDPENPLSSTNFWDYLKSKLIGLAIDAAVSGINDIDFLGTDINEKNEQELQKVIDEAVSNMPEGSQDPLEIPVKTWVYPTYSGGLILSRNIITGNYLGTDNLVQLVDSIGVNLAAGGYLGFSGTSPYNVGVTAQGFYQRTYSHLKPLFSVKQALKYKFKNMLVTSLKRSVVAEFESLNEESTDEDIFSAISTFKDNFSIGESFIITDSYGAGIGAYGGLNFWKEVGEVTAGISLNKSIISRLHINRRSDDIIQIYKDLGSIGFIKLSLDSSASVIPLLEAELKLTHGKAKSKFYNVKITGKSKLDTLATLKALRVLMVSNSVEAIEELVKPFVLEHKFKETETKLGFLSIRFNKIRSSNFMKLTTPNKQSKEMYRRYLGKVNGNDYQDFAFGVTNNLIKEAFDRNYNITGGSNNPGYSFLGKARNRIFTFEAVKDKEGKFSKPFVKMKRAWNGWKIGKEKAQKIVDKIRKKYVHQFFEPHVLDQSKEIFLYNFNVNFIFYEQGINHMLTLEEEDVQRIFQENRTRVLPRLRNARSVFKKSKPAKNFFDYMKSANKAKKANDIEKYSKAVLKGIDILEDYVDINGMARVLGGDDKFYSAASLEGYRDGDANGDKRIISHDFGEAGRMSMDGPLELIRKKTGMTEGEFLISWILKRAI